MTQWYRLAQLIVEEIDGAICAGEDERLSLGRLSRRLGYSRHHTARMFRAAAGMRLREYLAARRLAFALLDVRDTHVPLLEIAVKYGFSSHAAFTRAFRRAYGVSPSAYRERPAPVVLRTKITPLDCYLLKTGEIGMAATNGEVKIYFVRVPAHRYLHIKNYDSHGYFDFWEKQDRIPGQDCDTICGLLDSIRGKLDGDDNVIGRYSGQIMGYPREADGRIPEAYGVRMPADYTGPVPGGMLLLDVPEGEYIVFEHGPFDFGTQGGAAFQAVDQAIREFDWEASGCRRDDSPGRIAYYYHDPESFLKRVLPVARV